MLPDKDKKQGEIKIASVERPKVDNEALKNSVKEKNSAIRNNQTIRK